MALNALVGVGAANGLSPAPSQKSANPGAGFGALLDKTLAAMNGQLVTADSQLKQLAEGKGNLATVVEATSRANLDLELASQVRNDLIQAYQSIMNMQI